MAGVTEERAFIGQEPLTSRAQFIDTRRGRYVAQAMEMFEEALEKPLRRAGVFRDHPELEEGLRRAKGTFKRKLHALADDATEIMYLSDADMELNAYATEITDRLTPASTEE